MSTITKQAVQAVADLKVGYTLGHADVAILNELARIALASLEAEAVGEVIEQQSGMMMDGLVISEKPTYRNIKGIHKMKMMPLGTKFYTAPPAPANAEPVAWLWSHRKHPREVTLVRPEDDEKAEAALWSGWSCQALCAAPPAPVSVPDNRAITQHFDTIALETAREIMCDVNRRHEFLGGEVQLLSRIQCRIDDACRAAMLHGADGNSPVIPDGWVMVPEEPTHEMLEAGDEQFGTYDVYRRMIAAAPRWKVK